MSEIKVDNQYYEIDGILFDKDGTLLDFASLWLHWAISWIDHLQAANPDSDVSRADLAETIGVDVDHNSWDPTGPLAIGSNDDLKALLGSCLYKNGMPWNEAISLVIQSRESTDNSLDWEHYLQPIKGLRAFLEQLHQASIPLGIITSDDTQRAHHHLETLNIADYFTSVIGQDAVKREKPFPDSARKACQQLNIDPGKTLMIGDSNGDMITGKNAHMLATIGIVPEQIGTSRHLKQADQVITNYENSNLLT
ncbi:HAD family hydrolase [Barrientosiimonas marina]|uniref:HAD family hydrolase n=1 Tax=Lentibacillus kimchii TaxID=1542911 RepID=A0ABW2UQ64_9BACI